MYSTLDGDFNTLFPSQLSSNSKIYKDISFDKIIGRSEHGINLQRRKVQRKATNILLSQIENEQEHLQRVASQTVQKKLLDGKRPLDNSSVLADIKFKQLSISSKLSKKPSKLREKRHLGSVSIELQVSSVK